MMKIKNLKTSETIYDAFLREIVAAYLGKLADAAAEADDEDEAFRELLEEEMATPEGELTYYFSIEVDGIIGTLTDDTEVDSDVIAEELCYEFCYL